MTRNNLRRRALGSLAALAMIAAACSNASHHDVSKSGTGRSTTTSTGGSGAAGSSKHVPVDAPGVSDTEIKTASITSKTNPLGGNEGDLNNGIKAYFDSINSKGGIYGRKLVLSSEHDDQVSNNQTEAEALVGQDNVYAAFVATLLFTGAKTLEQAGIPTFGWNINAEWNGPKNFFYNSGAGVGCLGCLHRELVYAIGQAHAKRVAVLAYSVPQAKQSFDDDVKSLKQYGKNVGAEVVYQDASLAYGQNDYSPQVDQLKQKNVDFVVTVMDFNGVFALINEVDRQGLRDKLTFYHQNLFDSDFLAKNGKLLEGDYVIPRYLAIDHQPPTAAQKAFLDWMKSHKVNINEASTEGWIAAMQFVDALEAAGPHFTRQNLIAAWNRQTGYDAKGWLVPIDWTKEHDSSVAANARSTWQCANYLRIHDSKYAPVLDAGGAKPWVCFDNSMAENEWKDPVNVSFAGPPITYAQAASAAGSTTTTKTTTTK